MKLPVVLDIERFIIRVRLSDQFKIAYARGVPDYERVAKCLGGRYRIRRGVHRQAQGRQRRSRNGLRTKHTPGAGAVNHRASDRANQPVVGNARPVRHVRGAVRI